MTRTTTEYAAVFTHSGTVWDRWPTREQAQAFIDAAPAAMFVMSRQVDGDTHTQWVTA